MEKLRYEILKTLVFYGIFDFPLTLFEIYKNLSAKADAAGLSFVLDELKRENKIIECDGYYFLPQNISGADKRKARFLISFKKIKRAKKIAAVFARFPFIRFVGVCNSLGYLNAKEESDIDFFIIVKAGHLWTARFLAAVFLKIFNLRPKKNDIKDKICISFFAADDNLNIGNIALKDGDPYFIHWMSWIMPLYDDGVYDNFKNANSWIKERFPNFYWQSAGICNFSGTVFKKTAELLFGGRFERQLKNLQLKVLPRELKEASSRDDHSVVLSDTMLKFHLLDRRKEYRERYYQETANL